MKPNCYTHNLYIILSLYVRYMLSYYIKLPSRSRGCRNVVQYNIMVMGS